MLTFVERIKGERWETDIKIYCFTAMWQGLDMNVCACIQMKSLFFSSPSLLQSPAAESGTKDVFLLLLIPHFLLFNFLLAFFLLAFFTFHFFLSFFVTLLRYKESEQRFSGSSLRFCFSAVVFTSLFFFFYLLRYIQLF